MLSIVLLISFIILTPCLTYVLFMMIQHGQLLGKWQEVLDKIYSKNRFLAMFLGDCDKCFANCMSQITFIVYLLIQYNNEWLGWWNVLIWFLYFPLCVVLSVILINYIKRLGKISELEERIEKLENGM